MVCIHSKLRNLLGSLLVVTITFPCADHASQRDCFARLEAGFADPAMEYRTVPFNVWNGEVTPQEVERTLT